MRGPIYGETSTGVLVPLLVGTDGTLQTAATQAAVSAAIKAEDAAAVNADTGLPILGVRNDSEVDRTSTDGDYGMLAIDSKGRLIVLPAATERHLGSVGTEDEVLDVTCTLDTSAYASGDLLFDTQAVTGFTRVNAGKVVIESLLVLDEDDQGVAFDLYFLDANVSMGSENSAPSISDANARNILGFVPVATTDYRDLGGCRVACVRGIGLEIKAGAGVTTIYVAGVNGTGAPTFTATGLKLKIGRLGG
jgi:hypothetical protein